MRKIFIFLLLALSLFASQKLVVQLNWKPQYEFAAFYIAKEMGFYKAAGLDVELRHIDPKNGIDILRAVNEGRVDVGLYYSSIIPLAARSGKYTILSYLFQTSPFVALSKKDLTKYKKDACLYLSRNEYGGAIDLYLKKMGVHCKKVFDEDAFVKDPNGIVTYSVFKHYFDDKGYVKIKPKNFGFDFYDDILFANKEFYDKNKVVLRKFVLATMKGWRYALSHIDLSVKIIKEKYLPNQDERTLVHQAHDILTHTVISQRKLGIFNPQKLKTMLAVYQEGGILHRSYDIYDFVDPLFIDTIELTAKERELIASTPLLYSETTWPPFTIVQNGKMSGMIEEYFDLIRKRSGLDLRYVPKRSWSEVLMDIKNGTLDMAMATGETPKRREYAVFSHPYGTYTLGVATKNVSAVSTLEDLKQLNVAVGRDYTAQVTLEAYEGIDVAVVKDTKEAIEAVREGKADAAIDILPTVAYVMAQNYIYDLSLFNIKERDFELKTMFRKGLEPMRDIFDKALDSIDKEKKEALQRKYSSKIVFVINTQKERYFTLVIVVLTLMLVFALYVGRKFKKEIFKRRIAEAKLQKQVSIDPLTQLYNRRFFNTFMQTEFALIKRHGAKVLFGIFDIDNFKLYNDTYGHMAGDEVLKKVAKKAKTICKRKSDFVFRLGGEEFGVFTRIKQEENVQICINRLVEEMEAMGIVHEKNVPYGVVTISFGVVVADIAEGSDVSWESLYKTADELMYAAKAAGKNRAIVKEIAL